MEARRVAAFDWQNNSLLNSLRKKESAKPLQRFNLAVPSPGRGTIEIACGSEEFNPPFPFPSGASRGGVGSPDAGGTLRGNKKPLARNDAAGSPHKRAAAPLWIPCERAGAAHGPVRTIACFTEGSRRKIGPTLESLTRATGRYPAGEKKQRKAATAVLT